MNAYEVALVTTDEHVVLVPRRVAGRSLRLELADLLTDLVAGPDQAEHARGFSTALSAGVRLRLTTVETAVAVVDIGGRDPDADPRRLPLSVAQIVLTVTSHPAVDAVGLTRDGVPIEAPLPGGQLVDRALTAEDYVVLLAGKGHDPSRS
jgi:spore germination protein GerM